MASFITAVVGFSDRRTKHNSSLRRERRDGDDWKTRVSGRLDWQKSSPNDLYSMLYEASGVIPSRDPAAAALRV